MSNPYYNGPPPSQAYPPPQYGPPDAGYAPPQQGYEPYNQQYGPPAQQQPYDSGGYSQSGRHQSSYIPPGESSYYDQAPSHHSSHSPYPPKDQAPHSPSHNPPPSGPGAYADRGYDPGSERSRKKPSHEKERSIGAAIAGGAGGAFLGHELGGGPLATIGGMIAGAIGANALEQRHEKYVTLAITLGSLRAG
ncbi:hypothetical protein MMC20_001749 [Loxospora ochrophaea]|nr:hypothetical protein [Loxospora ochrophaea]